MRLVVGLGNPGPQYTNTRHNIGSRLVDCLSDLGAATHFFKPESFMNECGPEIAEKLRFYKLSSDDLLVIHDELDLPFGEMRLQYGRSSAGHHGVDSIIGALGTEAFWRLRVGIGPRGEVPGDQFVLERFSNVEENKMAEIANKAKEMVSDWLEKGQ